MIRKTRFVMGHRPYAVALDTLTVAPQARADMSTFWHVTVRAVWFRRRRGETVAVYGKLWDYQGEQPATAVDFLTVHTDGRYGGDAIARWDGDTLWSKGVTHAEGERILSSLLRPMLDRVGVVPPGYDGWWTYRGAR